MSNTLPPPPPPMVYAHVMPFAKLKGKATPETWHTALLDLQETREAQDCMRDVWAWEKAGCPAPKKQEPEQIALDARTCAQCGASFVPSVSRQVYCTSRCRMANRPSRAKGTENAFCANPECGLGFDRRNPKQAYCCERCASRACYLLRKSKEAAK